MGSRYGKHIDKGDSNALQLPTYPMPASRSVSCSEYKTDVLKFVNDLKENNSSAWECLREMTEEKSYRIYLMSIIEDLDDRYDVYLKGLVAFLEKIPAWTYDKNKGSGTHSLVAYLMRIINNKAGDYWRSKYRKGEISKVDLDVILNKRKENGPDDEPGEEGLAAELETNPAWSEESYEALEKCRESLSDEHYDIIERKVMRGQSYEEIARATGIPVGTLRERLSKAIKKLRDCMKKKLIEP